MAWGPEVRRALRAGGLLIADNARSQPAKLLALHTLVAADSDFAICLAPVGKGELMALKTLGAE